MGIEIQAEIDRIWVELRECQYKQDELEVRLRNVESQNDEYECLRHRVDPYSGGGNSLEDWLSGSRD